MSFRQVSYEVIQHIPILRETWVVSLQPRENDVGEGDQAVPFTCAIGRWRLSARGFSTHRFSDRHSLLLQAGGGSWPTASSKRGVHRRRQGRRARRISISIT